MASLVRQIVDLHRRQLAGVIEIRGVGRMRKLYADNRLELEDKLRHLIRTGRGDTFTANHLRAVLVQVADAVRAVEGGLEDHLVDTGRMAGNLAPRHLANMIGTLEAEAGRLTPVVQAAQAAVVRGVYAGVAPSLLDHYKRSARLYGPEAMRSIRAGLANSVVQNETVDQGVGRLLGDRGLFGLQRYRVDRIVRTEGAYSYGVTNQRSMEELRPAVPQMMKRLVATHDIRTGDDSEELDGQTVPVDQPYIWIVKDSRGEPTGKVVRYMQPPNRPNDREISIPWIASWGSPRQVTDLGPVTPIVPSGLA